MDDKRKRTKLLYLEKLFLEETDDEHKVSISEINQYLDSVGIKPVDRKTLYGDIEELRDFGMDILSEVKNGRNYYSLASRAFELPELMMLTDTVLASRFLTPEKANNLIAKLGALTSKYEADMIQSLVPIFMGLKSENQSIYYAVDTIHRAVLKNVQIEFQYGQWTVEKKLVPRHDGKIYRVSPWALVWNDENYYLVAYEEGKIKHFRIDKMLRVTLTPITRVGKEAYHAEDYLNRTMFGMFGGVSTHVTLEAENNKAGIIIDRFGQNTIIRQIDPLHFEATVEVVVSDQFFGWLIGLGTGIKLTGPAPIKERYEERIRQLYNQIQGSEP